ncbi:MAG: VPS10 domain-containing protein [Longimicrobiales bacterium]
MGQTRRCARRARVAGRAVAALSLAAALLTPAPRGAVAQAVDPSLLYALQPRSVGPAGMSGRIAALAVAPSDPSVIWVGAATGGVWKSTNAGTTFEPVFDSERVSSIGAIAVDPSASDVVWVGTGEGNPRNSAGVGAGVYRTLDGGRTWRLMGLERSERIHRIVVHPHDSDVVWVGAMGPAWSDGDERGVYKTTDGGRTWRRVLWVDERTGVADMALDPSNPQTILAAMWEHRREPWFFTSGGPGSGLWLSHDGGDTWNRLDEADGLPAGELGRIGLAVAPSDPRVVYALVEAERSALLRSRDGGRSWTTVNDEPGIANRPFYYADIAVDPTNENRVYNLASGVRVSEDGGRTFRPMAGDVHPDFHAIWIDPRDARHLLLGTDGGVWESRDRAATWRLFDNLPVGQFYHVSVDDAVPFNIYGGMQDNGSWRGPSDVWATGGIRNFHWKEIGFGDGFNALVDPRDAAYGYAMSQGGNLQRFDLRNGERKGIRPWAPDGVALRFNWNAAIALDPFEVGTVYYGSQFVHKSPDRGHTWQVISPDLTTNDPAKQRQAESGGLSRENTGAENHTTLLTIAPSPVEREVIWTGADDGKVQVTRAGGGTWDDLTPRIKGVPEGAWVPHIEVSRHAPGTAYVVFDDHRRGNWEPYMYRTVNNGRDWENLARKSGIDGFLHTVEEDPVAPKLLFAGGELGLWVSLDGGDAWFKWTHGFPTVPVTSLVVHPRDHDLVVGTHGRSIWVLDDIRPLRALAQSPALMADPVHVFEPPPAYLRATAATDGYHFSGDAMFQGGTRPRGALLTYWVGADSVGTADISIVDGMGRPVRTFPGPATRGLNRVVWDLRENAPAPAVTGRGAGQAPEVLPGVYGVRVGVGGVVVERSLAVLADPRVEVPLAEREEKLQALRSALALTTRLAHIESLAAAVREGLHAVRGALEGRPDLASLAAAADALEKGLADAADTRAVDGYRRSVTSLATSYDRPTEGQRVDLRRMEEAVSRLATGVNAFLAGDVAAFRRQVDGAGLSLFPDPGLVPDPGGG